jgi:hypothetical protein
MRESGSEIVYSTRITRAVTNAGVSVVSTGAGALVDPWWLGSLDENDVQGYAGTPVNVNELMPDVHEDVHAAGVVLPRPQQFFVAVDSGSDRFTGRGKPGRYVLRSWVNDMTPPALELLTRRVPAGSPVLVARVTDAQSGVDPGSLVLAFHGVQLGAESYDPETGLALFPTGGSGSVAAGRTRATVGASDFQETKNVTTYGSSVMPNTRRRRVTLTAVAGPVVTWLSACSRKPAFVAAGSPARTRSFRVVAGGRAVRVTRVRPGVYRVAAGGRRALRATLVDARGRTATAVRKACK